MECAGYAGYRISARVCNQTQRLFPYLAEGVADFYLPSLPPAKALDDTDTALTERLKYVLSGAAEGGVDPETLVPASRAELLPTLKEMGPMVLGVFDPIRSMDLMLEQKEKDRIRRKYRVWFGNTPRYWLFDLTPEGKIIAMQPASE